MFSELGNLCHRPSYGCGVVLSGEKYHELRTSNIMIALYIIDALAGVAFLIVTAKLVQGGNFSKWACITACAMTLEIGGFCHNMEYIAMKVEAWIQKRTPSYD